MSARIEAPRPGVRAGTSRIGAVRSVALPLPKTALEGTDAKPAPLPPAFRAIRDSPDLTEAEKIAAVWELLAPRGWSIIHPSGIPKGRA